MNQSNRTVLLIDDEKAIRQSLGAYLEDIGYRVFESENGPSGIKLVKEKQIDIVLCDLSMPQMTGLEVLQKLKEIEPTLPFIIVSGVGVIGDVVEALRLGAWDYLTKPVTDLGMLDHAINRSFERAALLKENELYKRDLEHANKRLKDNLDKLQEDQEAGRQIQFQLLPDQQKAIGAFRCSHYIKPSLHLSGDCIDYFQLDNQHLVFYLADVSGHGVSSAFVTVLLKSLMSQLVTRFNESGETMLLDPSIVLQHLNKELLNVDVKKYFTMFYGVINMQSSKLDYCVGGHFPSPILCSERPPFYMQGSGFPVGMFEWADYQNRTYQLPEAFRLMMFSDGVLEVLPQDSIEEKEAYLLSIVDGQEFTIDSQLSTLGLDEITSPPDDITLLLIERSVE